MKKTISRIAAISLIAISLAACTSQNPKTQKATAQEDTHAPLLEESASKADSSTSIVEQSDSATITAEDDLFRDIDHSQLLLENAIDNKGTQSYISLFFNTNLDPKQELDGLISIDGLDDIRLERQGRLLKVFYPSNAIADLTLHISELLKSSRGKYLKTDIEKHFKQEVLKPAIEIPLSGTVLPDKGNLKLPFRSVNLGAVDVEVVKIYADNVMSFLQERELDSHYGLRQVGRLIYKQTVRLDTDKSLDLHQWQNFSIELKDLFKQEKGAIYNIRLSFSKAYSLYNKSELGPIQLKSGLSSYDKDEWDKPRSYIERYAPDGYAYWWASGTEDPANDNYYKQSSLMPEYNLLASNLGLIVKNSDNQTFWCTVNDIVSTKPLEGIRITAYNYQLREMTSAYTDARGFVRFKTDGKPFIITASDNNSISYIKLDNSYQQSTSRFDVSGSSASDGIKAFTYAERGVWRPGDEIYLNIIVEDKFKSLPSQHPITMELYNPNDQLCDRQTNGKSSGGIYTFKTKTAEDAPTGLWTAKFKVGGQSFYHSIPVETIKPNRLKISISTPSILQEAQDNLIEIESHWLTGPAASGLETNLDLDLSANSHPFEQYKDYTFKNPLYSFSTTEYRILSCQLDAQGKASKMVKMPEAEEAPGLLKANIIARISEPGGDESITRKSLLYSPYKSYIGIKLDNTTYETDQDLRFPIVALSPEGQLLSSRKLEYKVYKLKWGWWHEASTSELTRYVQNSSAEVVAAGELLCSNGEAQLPLRISYPSYGRYLIYVKDVESGHATGGKVDIDWPDWRGRSDKSDPSAARILSFSLDKKSYEVGETAKVYLPAAKGARVLLSVETSSQVLKRIWVNCDEQESVHQLPITQDMAPNFYVHATLLQPYSQTVNDLPIRLYGIQSAQVINSASILKPVIKMSEEVLPQQEFSIKVSEQDGKAMSYTLAIVDEGLLDITAYKTPEPWKAMNQREALGITTWDMYEDVIGAYAGKFRSILSIGGDGGDMMVQSKDKRFNPVVKFLGPFTLTKGAQNTHKVTLPMYVGSVKVMLIAANNGSYGHADKSLLVRSPLMLLPSLPRFANCSDKISMPVNVFTTQKADVDLELSVEGPIKIVGSKSKSLIFSSEGEQLCEFELECDRKLSGKAKISITAVGAGQKICETVFLDVINPQPIIKEVTTKLVSGTESFSWDSSREASLELCTMPSINFSSAFHFVRDYSHYCSEQLSSRALFLLFAHSFLSEEKQAQAKTMISLILNTLMSRQLTNGGFRYWDSDIKSHEWVSSMAGEVMIEARRQGYELDAQAFERWIAYQKDAARKYKHTSEKAQDLIQAYRLYTLTLAGENPSAAMNKLRESKSISRQALCRLAAAYYMAGRSDVAAQLLDDSAKLAYINGSYNSFSSSLRDRAMQLESLVILGRATDAVVLAREIAQECKDEYYNTQELAYISVAMSRLAELTSSGDANVSIEEKGGKKLIVKDLHSVKHLDLSSSSVSIANNGSSSITASLYTSYRPEADYVLPSMANGVEIQISYSDLDGHSIALDSLKQGSEFVATIEVKKYGDGSESMALTYNVPASWEIWNDRLYSDKALKNVDIRDNRISWYFDIDALKIKVFKLRLRAAYCGDYVLPATICEDMYDPRTKAIASGRRIRIEK